MDDRQAARQISRQAGMLARFIIVHVFNRSDTERTLRRKLYKGHCAVPPMCVLVV